MVNIVEELVSLHKYQAGIDMVLEYDFVLQIHWPFRTKPGSRGWDPDVMAPLCLSETWTAMEGLYASGQARAIGVSNFSTKKLQDLLIYAKVPPAVVQVECHPVWQQTALHNLCKSTGVHLSVFFVQSFQFDDWHNLWYQMKLE